MDSHQSTEPKASQNRSREAPRGTQNRPKIAPGTSRSSPGRPGGTQERLGASPARPEGGPKVVRERPKAPQGRPGDPKRVPGSARRRLETTKFDAESPPGAKKVNYSSPGSLGKASRSDFRLIFASCAQRAHLNPLAQGGVYSRSALGGSSRRAASKNLENRLPD